MRTRTRVCERTYSVTILREKPSTVSLTNVFRLTHTNYSVMTYYTSQNMERMTNMYMCIFIFQFIFVGLFNAVLLKFRKLTV